MNLALFDFDGTITFKDSFAPFIKLSVNASMPITARIRALPVIAGYKMGIVSASRTRSKISALVFRGRPESEIRELGSNYARGTLPGTIRPKAEKRIAWHKAQADTVVVVSAALDMYLAEWCRLASLDVICTELEVVDGVLTGRYRGGDCVGPEKLRRIKQRYRLEDFAEIYAYGDTIEDSAMLSLASHRYFRWRELAGDVPQARRADHVDQNPDR
jgi:HAD superfamily hydrolase (TIGR01490 family)